jgi:long-chain acyl-CoA synthetase
MENHLIQMFNNRVHKHGTREVFRFRDKDGTFKSLSWVQLKDSVENLLSSLNALGCQKGEMVGIFSPNKPEWLKADLAVLANGSVVVPFYATASREQLKYIVDETEMRIMFVGSKDQLIVAQSLFDDSPSLQWLVLFDDYDGDDNRILGFDQFLNLAGLKGVKITLEELVNAYDSQDLATIIYTSGTTGEPKGVMLKHENFMYCFDIHDQRLNVTNTDVSLCFLPLSHVFERLWTHYLLHCGAVNVFLENPREVIEVLPKVKPTLMCTVPRFFDKTLMGIKEEVNKWPKIKQNIFKWSVDQGMSAIEYRCRGKRLPITLGFRVALAEKLVFRKLRGVFGGRIKAMPCSGAAINTETLKFFHAVGIFVNYGYGATETTATVSCFKTDRYVFGTCGAIMPGVEVKITENHEILVRGKSVFTGYYKKHQATNEVFTDGWFHTGDEGFIDDQNNLVMVDRIRDLMKTSVGKYVSPQKLELILGQDELVEQIVVVGDNRQYVSALIVPVMNKLKEIAISHKVGFTNERELISNPKIIEMVEKRFEILQKDLTPHERVVKVALLPEPFSIASGTMTSTMKLRRRTIENAYKDVIENLYP